MITKFAYCAMGLSLLCVILILCEPFLLRAREHFQFDSLGMASAADLVADKELRAETPGLVCGLILSISGVVAAAGLLRLREWARRAWLFICVLWLLLQIVLSSVAAPSLLILYPVAFRLIVLGIS